MKHQFGNTVVIGLGGSIIFQNEIDAKLLKSWKDLIVKYSKTKKFVIVMGGGKLARRYQEAAHFIRPISTKESDWLGIYATRANAKLVQTAFGKLADPMLFDSPTAIKKLTYPVTVACGWEPGWSTDYVCAAIAKQFGVSEVVMAGKPAFVFDKNPDQFIDARPFKAMKWSEYWDIIPHKWVPGASMPIDPVTAKFCKKNRVSAVVVDGKNLENLKQLIEGEEFDGTVIEK